MYAHPPSLALLGSLQDLTGIVMQLHHHVLYDLSAWLWVSINLHNCKCSIGVWVNTNYHRWALRTIKLACTREIHVFRSRHVERKFFEACMKQTIIHCFAPDFARGGSGDGLTSVAWLAPFTTSCRLPNTVVRPTPSNAMAILIRELYLTKCCLEARM